MAGRLLGFHAALSLAARDRLRQLLHAQHARRLRWNRRTVRRASIVADRPGDASHANNNRGNDNLIELGGGDHWAVYSAPAAGTASIPRWAGANASGDAASRYSYAMLDLTGAYATGQNASRVQRQVAHFKKSG